VIDIENYCVCKQKYMNEDLIGLIEQHKKDIGEWKQKESQWIRDRNQLEGNKKIIEELSSQIVEIRKRLAEALQIDESHQTLNGKIQERLTEVEEDNKKLSKQIEDLNRKLRRFGQGTY